MSAPKLRDRDDGADIDAARCEARAAYQAWQDAEQRMQQCQQAVGEAQQAYYALADRLHRLEGPLARRAARNAEISALEAALKELQQEDQL